MLSCFLFALSCPLSIVHCCLFPVPCLIGLTDNEDIQISTFQTFEHIASYHGSALLETLDQLPSIIMKSVKAHIAAVGQHATRTTNRTGGRTHIISTTSKT